MLPRRFHARQTEQATKRRIVVLRQPNDAVVDPIDIALEGSDNYAGIAVHETRFARQADADAKRDELKQRFLTDGKSLYCWSGINAPDILDDNVAAAF